jgi:PAS domain S-box-containing protein
VGPTAALRGDIGDALRRIRFPIATIDTKGRIAWQNDSMRELVGERVGRTFGEPVVAEDRQRFREQLMQTLLAGEPRDLEFSFRTRDDKVLRAEVSSAPLVEHGHIVGVFGIFYTDHDPGYVPPMQAQLTPRQHQVLVELGRGCSTKAIAARLGLSEETIRNHIRGIFQRLDVHSRLEAVVRAQEIGLL